MVDRFMPVAIDRTTLLFYRQRTKLIIRTEANLCTYLSTLTICLKSPLLTLAYFYEIQMPYPESASKTLLNIQSTVKYIIELPWDEVEMLAS